MSYKLPDIPSLPSSVHRDVRRAFGSLRGWLEAMRKEGGAVTLREVRQAVTEAARGDLAPPAAPESLTASGGFNQILLTWGAARGAVRYEIWRAEADDLGQAVPIGGTPAGSSVLVYPDAPPDSRLSKTYWYWVRGLSEGGAPGPYNAAAGTPGSTADEPAYVLEILRERITESALHQDLGTRIDKIEGLEAQVNSLAGEMIGTVFVQPGEPVPGVDGTPDPIPDNSRWYDSDDNNHPYLWYDSGSGLAWHDLADPRIGQNAAEIDSLETRMTAAEGTVSGHSSALQTLETTVAGHGDELTAQASQITSLQADVGENAAAILAEQTARSDADGALAQDINTLSAQVNDQATGLPAAHSAIQTEQVARADADSALAQDISTVQTTVGEHTAAIQTQSQSIDGLSAKYTVKVDAGGKVAGFGLASEPNEAGVNTSLFEVLADKFAIAHPGGSQVPFIVQDGKVYIDAALIRELTADLITAGTLNADKVNIANFSAAKILAGIISASGIYLGANSRIHLDGANQRIIVNDGTRERVRLGNLGTGWGIQIWDASGNTILGSGGEYSSQIANSASIVGGNEIPNCFQAQTWDGWYFMNNSGQSGRGFNHPGWFVSGAPPHTGFIHQSGAAAGNDFLYSNFYPIEAGASYGFSLYTATHRCNCQIFIEFTAEDGTWLGQTFWAENKVGEDGGGTALSQYERLFAYTVAPPNATKARIFIHKNPTIAGASDSWYFFTRPQFGRINPGQTEPPPWVPGPQIPNQGAFATLSRIDGANYSTYIEAAAIKNLMAYEAWIQRGNIVNAAVGTLQIGVDQVTVKEVFEAIAPVGISSDAWTYIGQVSIYVPPEAVGQPIVLWWSMFPNEGFYNPPDGSYGPAYSMRLLLNGAEQWNAYKPSGMWSLPATSAGTYTFRLEGDRTPYGGLSMSHRVMVADLGKR